MLPTISDPIRIQAPEAPWPTGTPAATSPGPASTSRAAAMGRPPGTSSHGPREHPPRAWFPVPSRPGGSWLSAVGAPDLAHGGVWCAGLMAMSQAKLQAPYIPGQKEAGDLVDEPGASGGSGDRGAAGKFMRFFGRSGDGGVKGGGRKEGGREKQHGDYYAPVKTDVGAKGGSQGTVGEELDGNPGGAEMTGLYSPEAGVDVAASADEPAGGQTNTKDTVGAGTDEHEQRGEERGSVVSGAGLVEASKGMANEVSESLVTVRVRVMEKLSGLQLPSESLEAVRRTFETGVKGAYATTRDAVQRTKQSLLDLFPSSLTSSSATEARKVVEDMEKDMLANSEGSGEDTSQVSEGPKAKDAAATTSEDSSPLFMRAKL